MHEMALAGALLELVEEALRQDPASRVLTVRVEIGALSHVEPGALTFCFGAVARGTPAEAAALEILRTPGRALCADCGGEVQIAAPGEACPVCGGQRLQICAGDEMRLRELEVV